MASVERGWSRWRWMIIFLPLALPILSPTLGLPDGVGTGLGLLGFALLGWGTGWMPVALVSMLIVGLNPLLGLATFEESAAGFGQPFVWLLISTFVISAAMESTGFGQRMALLILAVARGRASSTLLAVLVTVLLLSFLIPSSAGRSAMLLPICAGLVGVVQKGTLGQQSGAGVARHRRDGRGSNLARSIFLGMGFVSITSAWGSVTASISAVYAASTIRELTGYRWSYFHWLAACLPLLIVFVLCLWVVLMRLFPLEFDRIPDGIEYIRRELAALGRMSARERQVLLVLAVTLALWLTEPLHGLDVPLVALLASVALCLPVVGVQDWRDAARVVNWDVVILFAAAYSLAASLSASGTGAWMARQLTMAFPALPPWAAAAVLIAGVSVARLGFANLLGIVAILLPVSVELAGTWHLNAVWLAQITVIASSFGFFLPVQSPATLMAYGYGYFSTQDMVKAGLWTLLTISIISILGALVYWPLLGIAPR